MAQESHKLQIAQDLKNSPYEKATNPPKTRKSRIQQNTRYGSLAFVRIIDFSFLSILLKKVPIQGYLIRKDL